MKSILLKLSWRLIIIHMIALWLIAVAFHSLAMLRDTDFFLSLKLDVKHVDGQRLALFLIWIVCSRMIGLLVAFIMSIAIAWRENWHWLNSLLAFLFACLLIKVFDSPAPDILIFHLIGTPGNINLVIGLSALVMLVSGFVLLFLTSVLRFIENEKTAG